MTLSKYITPVESAGNKRGQGFSACLPGEKEILITNKNGIIIKGTSAFLNIFLTGDGQAQAIDERGNPVILFAQEPAGIGVMDALVKTVRGYLKMPVVIALNNIVK